MVQRAFRLRLDDPRTGFDHCRIVERTDDDENRSNMLRARRPNMLTSTFGTRPAPKEQMVPFSAMIFSSSGRLPADFHLDDAVDAGIVRQSENRHCEIVFLTVDNDVGAEFVRNFSFLLAAHRSDNSRAAPFGELHRVTADPARAPAHRRFCS